MTNTRSGIALSLFLAACVLVGGLLMHVFIEVRGAAADDELVARPGPAVAVLFDAGADAPAIAAPEPPPAAPSSPAPTVTAHSAPDDVAEAAWWALQAGYVGPGLLFVIFLGGVQAQRKKGYIVKRWPRLNDGRAWAVVAIVTSTTVTLLPLAGAEISGADPNALTFRVVFFHGASSLFLYLKSHLGGAEPAPTTSTAT